VLWADRNDWYFGVDMGIYHTLGPSPLVPVIPDGFLSLGVERHEQGRTRKSYVMWEENDVANIHQARSQDTNLLGQGFQFLRHFLDILGGAFRNCNQSF